MLRCIFIYLAKFGWDAKLVAEFCDIIEKRVVSVNTINQQTKTQKKKKRIEAENVISKLLNVTSRLEVV